MSEFRALWERKLRTFFKRIDVDGDEVLTKNDVDQIAENIITAGNFTSSYADEIRNTYTEIWNKYYKPESGSEATTCEEFLTKLKGNSNRDLATTCTGLYSQIFDTVDTSKDGTIQLREFIVFFNAVGIK